jgi:hypothetical protein
MTSFGKHRIFNFKFGSRNYFSRQNFKKIVDEYDRLFVAKIDEEVGLSVCTH